MNSIPISIETVKVVYRNIFIAEISYLLIWKFGTFEEHSFYSNFVRIFIIYVLQDIITYFTHRFLHSSHSVYVIIHSLHHSEYNPFCAWYATIFDFLLINIFPLFISIQIITISELIYNFIVVAGIYLSIDSHYKDSVHNIHYSKKNLRFGNGFYIMDRLMGTYNVSE
jgi:sterol desaturase/sphingolipid hydroxylase (fatty acid hydroxylase superfamily)